MAFYKAITSSSIPHPSLSRHLQNAGASPSLLHQLHEIRSSVLSLASNSEYIFSGSQNEDISVWEKQTFTLKSTLRGHTGSVLALELAKEKDWLFSSSGDSSVRIWHTTKLTPLYVLSPYLEIGAGDLFSLSWCPSLQTIYIGCQDTSLQWYDFTGLISSASDSSLPSLNSVSSSSYTDLTSLSHTGTSTPSTGTRKAHKFFDSYPQYVRRPADIFAKNPSKSGKQGSSSPPEGEYLPTGYGLLNVPASNVIDSAHYGYIYCMALLTHDGKEKDSVDGSVQLATGSGDETVKLWDCTPNGPILVHDFECWQGAVLALVAHNETIYAGCQDGHVKVLDLETKTLVRTIIVQEGVDILSMSMVGSDLYTCSADGWIKCWSASFDCTASWQGHDGIVLSSCIDRKHPDPGCLVTGGNDNYIKVWEVNPPKPRKEDQRLLPRTNVNDTMTYALSKFISIPSVSSIPSNIEDCRQAAIWLKKCLNQLGAQTSLVSLSRYHQLDAHGTVAQLPTGEGQNPLVLGTFNGTKGDKPKPRVLFYGHYDVIPAPEEGWLSDPFTLTGRNGYLYGRGVTDDKGPIIAIACAAADLLSRRALGCDLIFLIEGEEECGSLGFRETVGRYKDAIGDIDAILISSKLPDLHSGVEGGAVVEPMFDMVRLLASLTDAQRRVQIPGFYDHVRPQTEEEKKLYKLLSDVTQRPAASLSSRWREPSLTLHTIEVSGPKNATVIPGLVKSQVSVRVVPDQDLDTITEALIEYLETSFKTLQSPNNLKVNVEHKADWWLGNLDDHWFKSLESAVQDVWGVAPLRIREGGSIPSVPYLEKEFGCRALHLPMGQSSDQAHLPNERISLKNLHKGKAVVEKFLLNIAEKCAPNAP
ncbi:hypothetical protein C0992_003273 [Termitomyces sp. T32_za158]|nr:hypothetical protein C0992_003273 [Termitomyces sp. T32_za158]